MFFAFENYRYYLKPGPTDMRRQAEALARTVQSQMHLDPFSKSMFLFCSGRRTLLKVLVWDGSGFWLMSKRLYGGTFRWPSDARERGRCEAAAGWPGRVPAHPGAGGIPGVLGVKLSKKQ